MVHNRPQLLPKDYCYDESLKFSHFDLYRSKCLLSTERLIYLELFECRRIFLVMMRDEGLLVELTVSLYAFLG